MTRYSESQLAKLREQVRQDSGRIHEITEQQRGLRARLSELAGELREVTNRRDASLQDARRNGVAAEQLADDTGLSVGRIRQIAPGRTSAPRGRRPGSAAARGRRTEVTVPVDDAGDIEEDQAHDVPAAPAAGGWTAPPVNLAPGEPHTPAAPPDRPHVSRPPVAGARKRLPKVVGRYTVDERVDQALRETAGDIDAARDLLIGSAIDDAMTLLDACRAGAVYDYTAHPSLPAPLIRPGRKKSDMIWEGRPHWRNPTTPPGTVVHVLDVNGAYLAAIRKTHLPIGKLVRDDDPAAYNRKRAGIYLIEPPAWTLDFVPDPMGNGRTESGPVWVTTPTLRLLQRHYGSDQAVPILDSWTSGSSENLLTKFGDTLAGYRMQAIEQDDAVTLDYVKAMYSKFVSTAGDSAANHDIRRPEWVHSLRSQAFANLWLKGARAAACGLLVHAIVGTDELHVAGNWRAAVYNGRPAFPEGRGLAEIKHKRTYVVGERGDQELSDGG